MFNFKTDLCFRHFSSFYFFVGESTCDTKIIPKPLCITYVIFMINIFSYTTTSNKEAFFATLRLATGNSIHTYLLTGLVFSIPIHITVNIHDKKICLVLWCTVCEQDASLLVYLNLCFTSYQMLCLPCHFHF